MPALSELFKELGIVIPSDYDGACFRCGKPKHVRGDEEGLCIDCHDECEWSKAGFDEAVRSEIKAKRWYIQTNENYWKKSLLPNIHPEVLKGMGVEPGSADLNPRPVSDSIRGSDEAAVKCTGCGSAIPHDPNPPGLVLGEHRILYLLCSA